jgi:DNA-binding MarR family transcriptional regulator
MLIKRSILEKIVIGDVDRAFRRWKRPTVRSGGRLRTAVGELAIQEVEQVSIASLTDEDAHRAGYDRLEDLRFEMSRQPDRDLYRIVLRYHGSDRRELLRQDDDITEAECASILERINRIGAKAHIADLSLRILTWIDKCPDRRARDLADEIGMDTRKLKTHVRKLKEMGLTESRQIGYRLSARGQRVLEVARKNSAS